VPTEIRDLRVDMWKTVVSRHHVVLQAYRPMSSASEVMLRGTVAYEYNDGRKATKDFAAYAKLKVPSGLSRIQFEFYQVYMDMAA